MGWTLLDACHTKIGDFDLAKFVDEDVLWFDITVADIKGVTVLHSTKHLAKIKHGLIFPQRTMFVDETEQIALLNVFQNEVTRGK